MRLLHQWLDGQGVFFEINRKVTNFTFAGAADKTTVDSITVATAGESVAEARRIGVAPGDTVLVTLGSIIECSMPGTVESPTVFDSHIYESKWLSFTVTMQDLLLRQIVVSVGQSRSGDDDRRLGACFSAVDLHFEVGLFNIVLPAFDHDFAGCSGLRRRQIGEPGKNDAVIKRETAVIADLDWTPDGYIDDMGIEKLGHVTRDTPQPVCGSVWLSIFCPRVCHNRMQ